ncbi:MAG: cation-translocating P-type ATPase, partial [Actinobacteria bacterium]|nr:cation-translocating P-type ATPase [Actinomycetota bacterium]
KIISKSSPVKPEIFWHNHTLEDTQKLLGTDLKKGLSEKDAESRLTEHGANQLEEKRGRTPFKIFISQFNDFMIWILIAAAFISGILIREVTDAIVILIILLINSALGFVQEYRAEKALQALKELASPNALVIRTGKEKSIYSKNLVPGDIIKLSAGDLVSADCRVTEHVNLQADESILTGESEPVSKTTSVIPSRHIPLGDKKNLLFSGTIIVKGRCVAVVIGTGQHTEIGKIASMVQEEEGMTPLQIELKTVGMRIGIICIAVSVIVFVSGILKGNSVAQMLLVAVALAVAAIPEGLPAIVTVSLALGVQRMAKNNAIVRKLSSVETLGGVSVICTDKTGTLTENKMMVRKIYAGLDQVCEYDSYIEKYGKTSSSSDSNNKKDIYPSFKKPDRDLALKLLLDNAVLCNDAYYLDKEQGEITGDPTEAALIELADVYSLDKENMEGIYSRVMEEPFDSIRKMMTTVNKVPGDDSSGNDFILFSKGAPEVIVEKCTRIIKNGQITGIADSDRDNITDNNSLLAGKAMRNLAFAFKYLDSLPGEGGIEREEKELVYLGMVGMIDPPRPEVYGAIEKCKKANIKVIMVTGDHKITAAAIGMELGLLEPGDRIIDGLEFDDMTESELGEQIESIRIFARVSPSNKVAIVDALKKKQHIVAMTGDGINDAPSLKKADIGIAMGMVGTDVSKESSDMILTDDNFATIVKAIKQGRIIYDNLKKFILFLLSCNISEVLIMFVAIVTGDYIFYFITGQKGFLYIPLLPVQILWMNLITDGLPAMALGIDPPEKNIMDRKATKKKEPILSSRRLLMVSWQGLIMTIGALFVYFSGPVFFRDAPNIFQTMVFTTLVITQLLQTFNFRFDDRGIFTRDIFSNKYLNIAVSASMLLHLAIIYIPWFQDIFETAGLSLDHWLLVAASSILPVLLINFINGIIYKRRRSGVSY